MPNPITCLHIADLHFGMENYGFTNPKTGVHTRLEDFSNSLKQAVDYAIEHEIDIVLFAGDAYKRNSPSPTEQREFVKHFLRLADAGIPTVMIAGNHDIPVMHGKATSIDIFKNMRPDKFHVYSIRPTVENPPVIETKHGPIAVCCIPYISPSYLRNVIDTEGKSGKESAEAFQDFFQNLIEEMPNNVPDGVPRVLMAHLTVHGVSLGGYKGSPLMIDDIPILPSTLANAGYDYVALGHIHQHQNLSPREDVPVVYCGSIDRVDFGEADEQKGFVIAKIERGGSTFEYHPVNVREFVQIRVETKRGDDITERIIEEIGFEQHRLPGSVVKITYYADDDEVHTIDMKRIHESLEGVHFKTGFHRVPRETSNQRRRTTLSAEVTLADAMAAYIREHEELKDEAGALVDKMLDIEKTVRSQLSAPQSTS